MSSITWLRLGSFALFLITPRGVRSVISAQYSAPAIPPSYGQPATPQVVAYVVSALQHGDLASASAMVAQYRRLNGDTPEALEALGWLARGHAAAGQQDQALQESKEIQTASETSLATRSLDAEPHLPLALGTALEVQANVLNEQGKPSEALGTLKAALRRWPDTSLADRLQKNINLLTLQGKPAPLLKESEWIGVKPTPVSAWRGKVVLLFFWAHWCPDCKADAPIIAKLAAEFEPKGLLVIAPTRLYGYTADDEHAPPATERAFTEKVFQKYYSIIPKVQVPLDAGNFQRFGASTTPTIVLIDRGGRVAFYHPGALDEQSLRTPLAQLLATGGSARASK